MSVNNEANNVSNTTEQMYGCSAGVCFGVSCGSTGGFSASVSGCSSQIEAEQEMVKTLSSHGTLIENFSIR